ncbi:MAG: CHASE domain-containing protein [Anaerolineae bacterium]|nr:CHASE domain-containing protein [Anaerolineae bacterium]
MRVTRSVSPTVRYLIVGAIGIVLAVFVMQVLNRQAHEMAVARIERRTEQVTVSVQQSIESTLHVLESFQALYATSLNVDRKSFDTFALQMLWTHPEALRIQWAPYVVAGERADFEAAGREDYAPDFQIVERDDDGAVVRAAERDAYFPIYFRAPMDNPEGAVGMDLGADEARYATLLDIARRGTVAASPPTRFGTDEPYTIYIYQPIYAQSPQPATDSERLDALRGFVILVLQAGDFFAFAFNRVDIPGMAVAIHDADVPDVTLFETAPADMRESAFGACSSTESVVVAGRTWDLMFVVSEEGLWAEAQNSGLLGFLIVLSITVMLVLYLRQRTQAEAALHKYTRSLEEVNSELLAFNHTIAHDLKSPLAIIVGYADLLQDENLTSNGRRMLSMIPKMVDALLEMIEDLLKLAILRDAKAKVEKVDVNAVVQRTLERFGDSRDSIVIEGDLPPAMGHPQWMTEVFANLISNALKYRDDQRDLRIYIRAKPEGDRVRYEVEDNGLGIAPEDKARIFALFTRPNSSDERGLGIGLSIVQRMVTKLGGHLGVESELGKGSTFWFTLPKG